MKDFIKIGVLLDLYGNLLTENQKNILHWYVNEDLSLHEISELKGVSRQAAHDTIGKAVRQLEKYERALGLHKKNEELRMRLMGIKETLHSRDLHSARKDIETLLTDI